MTYQNLNLQFQIIAAIRQFFTQHGFLDVMTPVAVSHPGMEPHIHPFQVKATNPASHFSDDMYLNTSPEFSMKYLLSLGFEKIFTITYSFRDEPNSPIHRPQFLMLEWYRPGHYDLVKQDVEDLFNFTVNYLTTRNLPLHPSLTQKQDKNKSKNRNDNKNENKNNIIKFTKLTVQELFQRYLGIDILDYLDTAKLKTLIATRFPEVPLPTQNCPWEDYYFLLFLNKIEPHLAEIPFLMLDKFPAPLAALAKISAEDERTCDRFEIYVRGMEIANCFHELTDYALQEKRWMAFRQEKQCLYHYDLPRPNILLDALKSGIQPSSGIALGVERFGACLCGQKDLFWPQ